MKPQSAKILTAANLSVCLQQTCKLGKIQEKPTWWNCKSCPRPKCEFVTTSIVTQWYRSLQYPEVFVWNFQLWNTPWKEILFRSIIRLICLSRPFLLSNLFFFTFLLSNSMLYDVFQTFHLSSALTQLFLNISLHQNTTGHGSGQPALADPAWAEDLDQMISRGPFCDSAIFISLLPESHLQNKFCSSPSFLTYLVSLLANFPSPKLVYLLLLHSSPHGEWFSTNSIILFAWICQLN